MLSNGAEGLQPRAHEGNLGLGFESQFAIVNGVKLHFVEGGEGQRIVVLIPGWPQTWYAWHKIMPDVANTYHVVAVDIRGRRESTPPECGYDTQPVGNDISALMDQLGISRYS